MENNHCTGTRILFSCYSDKSLRMSCRNGNEKARFWRTSAHNKFDNPKASEPLKLKMRTRSQTTKKTKDSNLKTSTPSRQGSRSTRKVSSNVSDSNTSTNTSHPPKKFQRSSKKSGSPSVKEKNPTPNNINITRSRSRRDVTPQKKVEVPNDFKSSCKAKVVRSRVDSKTPIKQSLKAKTDGNSKSSNSNRKAKVVTSRVCSKTPIKQSLKAKTNSNSNSSITNRKAKVVTSQFHHKSLNSSSKKACKTPVKKVSNPPKLAPSPLKSIQNISLFKKPIYANAMKSWDESTDAKDVYDVLEDDGDESYRPIKRKRKKRAPTAREKTKMTKIVKKTIKVPPQNKLHTSPPIKSPKPIKKLTIFEPFQTSAPCSIRSNNDSQNMNVNKSVRLSGFKKGLFSSSTPGRSNLITPSVPKTIKFAVDKISTPKFIKPMSIKEQIDHCFGFDDSDDDNNDEKKTSRVNKNIEKSLVKTDEDEHVSLDEEDAIGDENIAVTNLVNKKYMSEAEEEDFLVWEINQSSEFSKIDENRHSSSCITRVKEEIGVEHSKMAEQKGFSHYFNSTTIYGRANSAKATLAALGGAFVYFKFLKGEKTILKAESLDFSAGILTKQKKFNLRLLLAPFASQYLKELNTNMSEVPPFPNILSTHSLVAKHAIACAVEFDDQHCGIYAGDEDSYVDFAEVFIPLICEYHGLPPSFAHTSDMDSTKIKGNIDPNAPVHSTRIRVGRSIQGFGLSPGITKQQRLDVENLMSHAFKKLKGDLSGNYYPLLGMEEGVRQQLVDDHFLFVSGDRNLKVGGMERDWPEGRGIFHNKEKSFLTWVNEEDQLRIISMEKGGDVKGVFERLARGIQAVGDSVKEESGKEFLLDPKLGYLHSCPTNLGTGMRASVHVDLPGWTKEGLPALKKRCEELALQPRGTRGESGGQTGVTYDISNKHRLGYSEVQLVQTMIDGV
ncbi:E2.7.3.2 [Lepeophtheirus salmonis]|uniref:arginine kinase n=1 Tax=Lepeophtheirus salmonis TaxID=72036 RepID=A0A7R8H820_LEPSM|nr:E2.7.3.2 [Lepeophtheirus salmonis]CAF2934056.1 E2.7.3.2 [Lepeophtheirus salmonis]